MPSRLREWLRISPHETAQNLCIMSKKIMNLISDIFSRKRKKRHKTAEKRKNEIYRYKEKVRQDF